MSTVSVYVDVDVDDIFHELDDDDLVEELQQRGYTCKKDSYDFEDALTKEEINALLTLLAHHDVGKQPLRWEWQRIRDKLMKMDYEK
jgi:hypothetical protein